ncbi:MAG: thiamine ABC transporter substrate-binding protein [Spirochaetaceae bacterium]|jgi:thiamine transport system substrate-binding protein|nr:thiamine ABC transporter substrate-binding protein [Spirochaetaceae bacterium]
MGKGKNYALLGLGALLGLLPAVPGYAKASQEKTPEPGPSEVVVWTYDSFNSEWGPGPEAAKRFFEETGITLTWVSHGDAGELLSRLLLEGPKADADVILGLDQNLAERALASGLLEAYKPSGADRIIPGLAFDRSYRLIPLDYSYFAIVYDAERVPEPPQSLEDLTAEAYEHKLILMDPRTSSPGLGFLAWTMDVYGADWKAYWRRLAPSILTIADGWSSGYGLFTAGEAPLVLSYTTSPGYHLEYEGSERYQAALFTQGHPLQIEVAGLLAAGTHKEEGKKFLDFMLSSSFQQLIPLTNWMYPVMDIPLPDSFRINPKSETSRYPATPTQEDLTEWASLMTQIQGR